MFVYLCIYMDGYMHVFIALRMVLVYGMQILGKIGVISLRSSELVCMHA
jgi:hypothetical protein